MAEPDPPKGEVTRLLRQWSLGDASQSERLFELIYHQLQTQAHRQLRKERNDHTLQTSDLVHEAYLRLIGQRSVPWQSRRHFLAIAAQAMRRILLDHARRGLANKRIGPADRIPFDDAAARKIVPALNMETFDLLALDDALTRLAELDKKQARLVELRFFAGLTIRDTAAILELSPATVKRQWQLVQAWLRREMTAG